MWVLLKAFLLRWVLLRVLIKSLGSLAVLLPLALFLLKLGWPVLLVLLGLPVLTVMIVGGTLIGIVGFAITAGLGVLGILLPIVLPIVAIVLLLRWLSKRPFRPGTDSI